MESELPWSSELDHVLLIHRRKLLLANRSSATQHQIKTGSGTNVVIKQEVEQCDSLAPFPFASSSPASKGMQKWLQQQQSPETKVSLEVDSVDGHNKMNMDPVVADNSSANVKRFQDLGVATNCDNQGLKVDILHQLPQFEVNAHATGLEKVDSRGSAIIQNPMMCDEPANVKVECTDNQKSSLGDSTSDFPAADVQTQQLGSNDSINFTDELDNIVLKDRLRMLLRSTLFEPAKRSREEMLVGLNFSPKEDYVLGDIGSTSSLNLNLFGVKSETLDYDEMDSSIPCSAIPVKNEPDTLSEPDDNIDHMQLGDRMKMQRTEDCLNVSRDFDCLRKGFHTAIDYDPFVSETPNPLRVNRPRKRKKTATDSIETALEEDAPGLLQVLIAQGVSIDELKLYGEPESNEIIDESFIEEGFSELEAVISKLFSQRDSLLKFAPVRCTKGSKPSYCLACLFSLVEQTRYLRFRNWPAEWGWCRDLHSFIFVFERHNRIVLERPEYGYATYFFELVDSLPIDWQIKRLVTAMKLTNCGRITLIENRALVVGEDLTEGEAQVLMQYGWTPNSGLGTMLNYCDRVVHDRKSEKESLEWRSKIGKLLMNGYNGGTIVSNNIKPPNVLDCKGGESSEIKMEF